MTQNNNYQDQSDDWQDEDSELATQGDDFEDPQDEDLDESDLDDLRPSAPAELSPEEVLARQMAETQALIDKLLGNLAPPKPQPKLPTWQPQVNIGLWVREVCTCGSIQDRFVGWFIKQRHTRLRAFECVRAPLGRPDPDLPTSHQFMASDITLCSACHAGPQLQPFEDLAFDKRNP